jgi:CheY-like chemotaxis protein
MGSDVLDRVPALASGWEPRVLVVDDDDVARFAAEQVLKRLGFTVDLAGDGREAVNMSARWPYVAIFMDCGMPETDGYTAAREISHREGLGGHTPVIAVTSRPRSVCLASGMDHHMAKPLRLEVLRRDLTQLGLFAHHGASPTEPGGTGGVDTPLLRSPLKAPGDDPVWAAEVAATFITQAALRLPELWRAANTGDCSALQRIAHGLKQNAAVAGAARIADLCDRLCEAAAGGDTRLAVGIEPQVRQAFGDTAAAIRFRPDRAASADAGVALAADADGVGLTTDSHGPQPRGLVRVAIADDDPLARCAIEAMIDGGDGLVFVGSAEGVEGVVDLAVVKRPDVIVLDWMMPGGGGSAAARRILSLSPETRIVALTASDSSDARFEMTHAGASGFLVKGCSAEKLARTIHQALQARHEHARAEWAAASG